MSKRNKRLSEAEALVRRVLGKQKIDKETVRAVAEKLTEIVAESAPKKASGAPKKKAA